jgi:competence protein ComEC
VLLAARAIGGHQRWHGLLIIVVVLIYLFVVEVRMPVLRAGVMTIAASLALVWGRRLRVSGLVALSAILLLLYRPDQLFNAGFQLTFGVVLGLVHLAPRVRRRWFGPPQYEAQTVGEMIGQCAKTALVVSIVAWLIATPIAAFHFGMIAPLGIPLSLIAVPLSAAILALGYLKIALSAVLPSIALVIGIPLSILADVLLTIVLVSDSIPWSRAYVPYPSVTWSLLALGWVTWWGLGRGWREQLGLAQVVVLVALIAWLLWPIRYANGNADHLRIDMLAVGDGSCYVVRDGESTVMFDAGSSTDLNVGRRSLVPALRRLGVRSIDALAISHADLDHYSAVLELCDEFDVAEVLVTPQFMEEARAIPEGPVAFLMQALTMRRVAVQEIAAGQSRVFGRATWNWMHPQADGRYERSNEGSMVISVEHPPRRVLFCGDIQSLATKTLLANGPISQADVLELPHHGSFDDTAVKFVQAIKPSIVMQSTGWARWRRDKWAEHLKHVERLVTVRDGACTVEIDPAGEMVVHRFLCAENDPNGATRVPSVRTNSTQ